MNEYVKLSIKKEIGYIEFFHHQSNALPANILTKLAQTISDAGKNDEIKVVVLGSGGERAFCAGASFDELSNIEERFSFDQKINKCSFYGKKNEYNSKAHKLIQSNHLNSFNHLFSDNINGLELRVFSHGKDLFSWSTSCTGDIWNQENSDEYYLGIKYKNPELKNTDADHYYMRTDKLFGDINTLKIIKDTIFDITGSRKVQFDSGDIIKAFEGLDFKL